MSKVFAGYHVVFVTKNRQNTLPADVRMNLYHYIYGILKKYECKTFRINGMGEHVHLAFDLNPEISLSNLIRDIKRSTSVKLRDDENFPLFYGWGRGYYACTFSPEVRDRVINYIKNQEEHHAHKSIEEELKWLTIKAGMTYFDNDYV